MAKTQSRELGFYCYVAWLASYDLPICRAYIRCSVRQHESVGDIERRKIKNISLDTSRGTFFYFFLCTAAAIVFSFRHIAPHLARDLDQGFGLMVLGVHTYFWAEVVFWALIILLGVMFFFAPRVLGPASENGNNWRTLNCWG